MTDLELGLMAGIVGLLLIAGCLLAWAWKTVGSLQKRVNGIQQAPLMNSPNLEKLLTAEEPRLLTVEILNCAELAADRSKLGEHLSALAPNAIRAAVYKIVAKQMREQLERQGVKANVQVQKLG